MKTKAIIDIYVDENLAIRAGESCTVEWADDFKGRVFLLDADKKEFSVSVLVFNSFFK